jgi:hypothetical protein
MFSNLKKKKTIATNLFATMCEFFDPKLKTNESLQQPLPYVKGIMNFKVSYICMFVVVGI